MKKIILALICVVSLAGCDEDFQAKQVKDRAQRQANIAAVAAVEIPHVQFFLEKKIVAKWVKTWDNDKKISFVYVFMFGKPIGYYIVNGKPVSSRSYLLPEQEKKYEVVLPTQALDGTYGEDNVGWHFFTALGVAVAVEGVGATILFTDVKLPVEVPVLGR